MKLSELMNWILFATCFTLSRCHYREEFAQLTKQTLCVIDPALSDTTLDSQYFSDTDSDAVMFAQLLVSWTVTDARFSHLWKSRQEAAKCYTWLHIHLARQPCQDGLHVFADSEDISTWAICMYSGSTGIMQESAKTSLTLRTHAWAGCIYDVASVWLYNGNTGQKIASDRTITCSNGDIRIHNAIDSLSVVPVYPKLQIRWL